MMPRRRRSTLAAVVAALVVVLDRAEGCRWVMYVGADDVEVGSVILDQAHGLVGMGIASAAEHTPGARSSPRWNATQFGQRNVDENLDGWGVCWYVDGSGYPRRMRSAEPVASADGRPHGDLVALVRGTDLVVPFMATNNSCVSDAVDLAPRPGPLRSKAVIGHVRAASTGGLDRRNSHPFVFNTLTWVHNGAIADFDDVKDRMRSLVDDASVDLVAGDTDSEFAGAVFVDKLHGFPLGPTYTLDRLRAAMRATLHFVADLALDGSSLNFGVTDGSQVVVARFRSTPDEDPPTLYYKLLPDHNGILVASEPLDVDPHRLLDWTLLGKDRLLSFSPQAGLLVDCVDPASAACDADLPVATPHPDGRPRVAP